jgi:hypothetical protein
MDYIIKLFDGGILRITELEYKKLLELWQKEDKFAFPSTGQLIDKKLISRILTLDEYNAEKTSNDTEKRRKQQTGILHDGIKVIKHYGKWVKADTAYYDNAGNIHYEGTEFDLNYYPELALNQIKTPEEFFEWKNNKENLPYLPECGDNNLRLNNGFASIDELF